MFLFIRNKLDKDPVKREQCANVHTTIVKVSFLKCYDHLIYGGAITFNMPQTRALSFLVTDICMHMLTYIFQGLFNDVFVKNNI